MNASDDLKHEHDIILFAMDVIDEFSRLLNANVEVPREDISAILGFLKIFVEKCHHGKEEGILFPVLEEEGVPAHSGPISIMLAEHQEGRGYVRIMEDSLEHEPFHRDKFLKAAADYTALVRSHIEKENSVFFPLGDEKLPEARQEWLLSEFELFEEKAIGKGMHEELYGNLDYFRRKYMQA